MDVGDRLFIGKNSGTVKELPLADGTVKSVDLSLPSSLFTVSFFAGSLTPYLYSNWREMDRRENGGTEFSN
jgi:hypothetical protein